MKTVSAADANRHFSKILRDVKAGETVLVTSRGAPVARIGPIPDATEALSARQIAARRLLDRLRSQPVSNGTRDWTRDDLYDDDF